MQATPTRMSTPARDDNDSQSESGDLLKRIRVTIALIILGSEQHIEPLAFWKTTLEALGPSYTSTYIPGNFPHLSG